MYVLWTQFRSHAYGSEVLQSHHPSAIIEMKPMAILEDRRKRGAEILKKVTRSSDANKFDAAADLIADILLSVADSQDDAEQILRAAEMDFRCLIETEHCAEEG
jgi:hypothetical protein